MSKSRRGYTTGIVAALLPLMWFGFTHATRAQTSPPDSRPATGAKGIAAPLQRQVEGRKVFLDRQERRRLEILDRLEFTPKPFRPFPRLCFFPPPTAAAAIDPHRSLFVHDRATFDASGGGFTANFSLNRTLTQIATQVAPVVPGTSAESIFRQLWDTQNAAPGVTTGPHCTDNDTAINGFPITCPRNEGSEAIGTPAEIQMRINEYAVLALVNRLDLAHQGWRNCGEYRIIYGKQGLGKNLIIFEAVLPNPRPGCREGCVPVAEFWKSLSSIDDPVARAKQLENFFYTGLPGFRPVVHVDHYSAAGVSTGYGSSGSGQIRTNQFLQTGNFQPWLLKEFKTVVDCGIAPCTFSMVPISVKNNPHGPLWNEDDPHPLGPNFRADTIAQLGKLSSGALMQIGYDVAPAHNAGQSMSLPGAGFVDNYRDQMNTAAAVAFRAALGAGALTADQIANRAIALSCAGCHQPRTFGIQLPDSIGTVTTPVGSLVPTVDSWPEVVGAGFVHVDVPPDIQPELAANPAAFGAGLGQEISPALLQFFLPERKNFLLGQLNAVRCACVCRFQFLPPLVRARAIEIERGVEQKFTERFHALDRKLTDLEVRPVQERRGLEQLLQERTQLLAERDKARITALQSAKITLPDAEVLDLRVRPMRLKAGAAAKDDPLRASALRLREVNELLLREPPRRTVTGSFRPH
jgi:hypothetical protein